MTRIAKLLKPLSGLLLALTILFTLTISASAEPTTTRMAPAGNGSYEFTLDLRVTESTPYAGIQFGLTLSSESNLSFNSFKLTGVNGTIHPMTKAENGVYYFGFWTSTNAYSGEQDVGSLTFTYTGSAPQKITITEMKVARLVEGSTTPVVTDKGSPIYSVNVVRTSTPEDNTGNGTGDNNNNNTGNNNNVTDNTPATYGQTGNQQIVIGEDETPLAEGAGVNYFDDVDDIRYPWAVNEINYLFEQGVIKGTGDRLYSPSANITRGDFMLMLVRAFNLTAETNGNFPDVPEDSYYYEAIAIAKALGIALGDGVSFHPTAFITRQDMMVLIDRTLQKINKPLSTGEISALSSFSDYAQIADYAQGSVATLVKSDIIKGDGNGINPLGNTTRAEMAVVLYRVLMIG